MKKKLLALLLAMAMAICLVFALPACNDAEDEENRNEQNENNNSGSDDGEDIAALVSQYIENSLAQEYITINFNGTADVESSDSYYGEEYTDSYNSTINAALMIAENDEYGVDMSISTVTDGTYSSDIFKDGVYYSSQNRESILETPLYTRRNDYYLGYQTRAEIAAYADMAVLAAELADNSDRLGISGITVSAENSDGGKLLTLEVNMGEC